MGCLISSSITSNWIHTAIPYSCSAESGLTGSKQSIMKGTASSFYTNGMKTGASNGRGPAKMIIPGLFESSVRTLRTTHSGDSEPLYRLYYIDFFIATSSIPAFSTSGKSGMRMRGYIRRIVSRLIRTPRYFRMREVLWALKDIETQRLIRSRDSVST